MLFRGRKYMNKFAIAVEHPDRSATGTPRLLSVLAVAAGLLLGTGCGKEQVSRTEVTPPVPPPASSAPGAMPAHGAMPGMPPAMGGAMPAMPPAAGGAMPAMPPAGMPGAMPGAQAGAMPPPAMPAANNALKWTLPQGWTSTAGSGMRYATLTPPGGGKAEVSVVVLPGPAGGEMANVNRWRGQIGLPPLDEAGLAAARKVVKSKAGEVAVYDFSADGTPKARMITGLLASADGNTWFFKLMGEAEPVGKAKAGFMRFLETLHVG
jgi:hypothetical protein